MRQAYSRHGIYRSNSITNLTTSHSSLISHHYLISPFYYLRSSFLPFLTYFALFLSSPPFKYTPSPSLPSPPFPPLPLPLPTLPSPALPSLTSLLNGSGVQAGFVVRPCLPNGNRGVCRRFPKKTGDGNNVELIQSFKCTPPAMTCMRRQTLVRLLLLPTPLIITDTWNTTDWVSA